VRHLLAAGGLAIVACTCGLLFSDAASARQATNTFTVAGTQTGPTSIKFSGFGTAIRGVGFYPGSNFKWQSVSSTGGNCQINVTNGFAYCAYSQPVTSIVADLTLTGPIPPQVAGQVIYFDSSTGTFTAAVSGSATPGNPSISHAFLRGLASGKLDFGLTLTKGLNGPKFSRFDVYAPFGLEFKRRLVDEGKACHGRGDWKSSWINAQEIRCKPWSPLATSSVTIKSPAFFETDAFRHRFEKHKIKMLRFGIDVALVNGQLIDLSWIDRL
jgi:hypothetical protein